MEIILDPNAPPPAGDPPGAAPSDAVKNSDTANFEADVIAASAVVPVIVDFWAPWCEPCKTLGPAIEKLVRQTAGLVRLVKINIDDNQDLAMQLRIQSIPTVYAFRDGQPVDGFVGAQSESQLRQFIDRLTKGKATPLEQALEGAEAALGAGDVEAAAAAYGKILGQDPSHAGATAGMIRCLIAGGDIEAAKTFVDRLADDVAKAPAVAAAVSALELAEQSSGAGDADELTSRLERDPDDHQARFDLATAHYAAGRNEAAVEHLVELVRRDRTWNDEAARKQLVKVFDALGPADPLTVSARRQLSSILFS